MKKNIVISIISLIVIVFFFAACGEKESTYFPQEWGKLISSSPVLWGENISE
jgi:hypothetical protein